MEGPYAQFLQLATAESSIFAADLMALLKTVGRPVAEFKGIVIPGVPPAALHWEVECTLRGAVTPPETATIVFVVRADTWLEGIRRATQEAIARLARQDQERLLGTRFHFYGRRNEDGDPTYGVHHPELGYHLNRMEYHLIGTQAELDESRAQQDVTSQALHVSQHELEAKNQELAMLKEQMTNLQNINMTLINYTQFLKGKIALMEATLGENTDESQSATHTPDADDPEMEEDPEEPILIEDE